VQSNGWIFYDSIQMPHREWAPSLEAFTAAIEAGREAARAWPYRENLEKVSGVRPGDQYDVFRSVESAVEAATEHSDLLSLRWDYSQSGDQLPESMKIRSYAVTASRGVGLTLYASSPIESEVPELLFAVRQAAETKLDRDAR
jgi:hypothetical protein